MVQVLLYVGGIVVLTIFAVMLTQGIGDVAVSNREVGIVPSLVAVVDPRRGDAVCEITTPWHMAPPRSHRSATTYGVGNAFFDAYVLPFEVASLVLLAALVGAIVISRQETRQKENQGASRWAGELLYIISWSWA